jgi:hypothetical protein
MAALLDLAIAAAAAPARDDGDNASILTDWGPPAPRGRRGGRERGRAGPSARRGGVPSAGPVGRRVSPIAEKVNNVDVIYPRTDAAVKPRERDPT